MLKKAAGLTRPTPARRDAPFRGQGRNERRGESYFVLYVEPLSEARTPLADFFSILLKNQKYRQDHHHTQRHAQGIVLRLPALDEA